MGSDKRLGMAELLALIDDEKLDEVANYLYTRSRFTDDDLNVSHYVQLVANIRRERPVAWDDIRRRVGKLARERVGGSVHHA